MDSNGLYVLQTDMSDLVTACAILHNMVVECRKSSYASKINELNISPQQVPMFLEWIRKPGNAREQLLRWKAIEDLEDISQHQEIKRALTRYNWILFGGSS